MSEYILRSSPSQLDGIESLLKTMVSVAEDKVDKEKDKDPVLKPAKRILMRIATSRNIGVGPDGNHVVYLLKSDANFLQSLSETLQVKELGPLEVRST